MLYPNMMFKEKGEEGLKIMEARRDELVDEYIIQPFDLFSLQVFGQNGMDLIDMVGQGSSFANMQRGQFINYLTDKEGYADIPMLGRMKISGFTERQLELKLQKDFSYYFVDPFVVVTVTNRRVFLFKNSMGQVIPLNEAPTSLFEVLAISGGLGNDLKAYDIKIIRGDLRDPEIYKADLSNFTGLKEAELLVQTNDIIYVAPRRRPFIDGTKELSSVLTAFSVILSMATLIVTIKNLSGN